MLPSHSGKGIDGAIELKYCSFDRVLAHMLTKGFSGTIFNRLRKMAGIVPVLVMSEKEC